VKSDIRKNDPYAAYGVADFEVITEANGDVRARAWVRAGEITESIKIIRRLLDNLPAGELKAKVSEPLAGEEMSRVESPRGELMYYLKSNGGNVPERVKMRTPSYMNDRSLVEMLREERLSDLPIILESIDRCISCTNRLTIIDERTGRRKLANLTELRR
jgi:Ni,Fe-hydrogenase III large subunit